MFVTPEMAAKVLGRKLQRLRNVPSEVIDQAHRMLMPKIPVYTGTYEEAVEVVHSISAASLRVTSQGLLASAEINVTAAMEAAQAQGKEWTFGGPAEYIGRFPHYLPRIEAFGSPKQQMGQFAWREVAGVVALDLPAAIRKAYNG